jgi:thioredoxin-related protein
LAYLDQLNEGFGDAGLKVLTINANKPNILNQVRPYINKRKYKFPVSVDPRSKLAKKFGVMGFPTLFLVDKNGEILHKSSGYEDGQEDIYLAELIKYLDSENIDYGDFEYEKQLSNQSDASIMNIDF